MTMISIHLESLNSKIASYHEFLSRYSKTNPVVYGFVEGKDDPCFYRGFIDHVIPDGWEVELWPAGNKDQVYRIHEDLDWRRFPKERVCFFVDQDLSNIVPELIVRDLNIFVTDGYSIENDVVSKTTCKRVLTEVCGFANTNHEEMDAVCELFEQELEAFCTAMIPVMAWILHWRRNGKRPNLSDLKMRDLFDVKIGRLQTKAKPKGQVNITEYVHSQCKVTFDPVIDIGSVEAEMRKGRIYRKLTRGKYVFWFLVEFCNSVRRDAILVFKSLTKPPPMNVTFSSTNGMAIIGNRARIPRSLSKFLNGTYCVYIQKQAK